MLGTAGFLTGSRFLACTEANSTFVKHKFNDLFQPASGDFSSCDELAGAVARSTCRVGERFFLVNRLCCFFADALPHLEAIDRNICIGFKAQSHATLLDFDNRDFDHASKSFASSNYNSFVVFPRKNQHSRASIGVNSSPGDKKVDCAVNP